MSLSRNNTVDSWIHSASLLKSGLKMAWEGIRKYSTKDLDHFTESITLKNGGTYEFFVYEIKHISGWKCSVNFLKVNIGTEWMPIYMLAPDKTTGKEKYFWFCKEQLSVFSKFNSVF